MTLCLNMNVTVYSSLIPAWRCSCNTLFLLPTGMTLLHCLLLTTGFNPSIWLHTSPMPWYRYTLKFNDELHATVQALDGGRSLLFASLWGLNFTQNYGWMIIFTSRNAFSFQIRNVAVCPSKIPFQFHNSSLLFPKYTNLFAYHTTMALVHLYY